MRNIKIISLKTSRLSLRETGKEMGDDLINTQARSFILSHPQALTWKNAGCVGLSMLWTTDG